MRKINNACPVTHCSRIGRLLRVLFGLKIRGDFADTLQPHILPLKSLRPREREKKNSCVTGGSLLMPHTNRSAIRLLTRADKWPKICACKMPASSKWIIGGNKLIWTDTQTAAETANQLWETLKWQTMNKQINTIKWKKFDLPTSSFQITALYSAVSSNSPTPSRWTCSSAQSEAVTF